MSDENLSSPTLFSLPQTSKEQYNILETFKTENVIISSVAGSGKTTLALQCVTYFNTSRFLIVTYNRALCEECNTKIQKLGLQDRAQCFTYHALLSRVCNNLPCCDDFMFHDLMQSHFGNIDSKNVNTIDVNIPEFDALIVDEMQDQRRHHFEFLFRLLEKSKKRDYRFFMVGDENQLLYDFYKTDPADKRFLLMADKLYARFTDVPFKNQNLTTSYRSTPNIAKFVNKIFDSPLQPGNFKAANKPVEIIVSKLFNYDLVKKLYQIIIENSPNNVAILSNTVTKSRSLKKIVNSLQQKGLHFYLSRNDIKQEHSRIVKQNKVIVETFCSVKGLQKPCVIIFGVDYWLNQKSKKNSSNFNFNQIYVALTRSCAGRLYIVHDANIEAPWLRQFLEDDSLKKVTKFTCIDSLKLGVADWSPIAHSGKNFEDKKITQQKVKFRTFVVHDLVRFIDVRDLKTCLQFIEFTSVTKKEGLQKHSISSGIETTCKNTLVRFGGRQEDVCEIIKKAVCLCVEHIRTKQCVEIEEMMTPFYDLEKKKNQNNDIAFSEEAEKFFLKKRFKQNFALKKARKIKQLYEDQKHLLTYDVRSWLELANGVLCYKNYSCSFYQVKNYDWCDDFFLDDIVQCFLNFFLDRQFVYFNAKNTVFKENFRIVGTVQACNQTECLLVVLEQNFTTETILQGAICLELGKYQTCFIYNLYDGKIMRITKNTDYIQQESVVCEFLVNCKQQDFEKKNLLPNDNLFLQNLGV
jgi:hypothetical protein